MLTNAVSVVNLIFAPTATTSVRSSAISTEYGMDRLIISITLLKLRDKVVGLTVRPIQGNDKKVVFTINFTN